MVKVIAQNLSEKTGSRVSIEKVSFSLTGNFLISNLQVDDYIGNELIKIEKLSAGYGWYSRIKKIINLHHLEIEGLTFSIVKYHGAEGDNLWYFLKHFATENEPDTLVANKKPSRWIIELDNLRLLNAKFVYENVDDRTPGPGIDFDDISLENINFQANDIRFEGDTIRAGIKSLTLIEKSGFDIREFSGDARFSPDGLGVEGLKACVNNSTLDLDFSFGYDHLADFNDFLEKIRINGKFRQTELQMSDIGYFAPIMFSMNDLIKIKGDVSGTVASFNGRNLEIKYGQKTVYEGNIRMNGLPDITETFIHADIKNFTTSAGDVENFALPAGSGDIPVPALLYELGMVRVRGKFTGFYNDFVSKAQFTSRIGRLNTNIVLKTAKDGGLTYSGLLEASNLDVGKLFGQTKILGSASFFLNVDGSGINMEKLDITMKGTIREVGFKGYNYQNIVLDGNLNKRIFEGNVAMNDQNLDFTFSGLIDLNKTLPRFHFTSRVNHANLYQLKLTDHDSVSVFSSVFNFGFSGNNLDNLAGNIRIDSVRYTDSFHQYFLKELTVNTFEDEQTQNRKLTLESDYVDATFSGRFKFSQIAGSVKNYLARYSTLLASGIHAGTADIGQQLVSFRIDIKNSTAITQLFIPELSLAPNTTLEGNYNSSESLLFVNGNSRFISFSGIKATNVLLSSASEAGAFNFAVEFSKLLLKEPSENDTTGIGIDSLQIKTTLRADSLLFAVAWNDLSNRQRNRGAVQGIARIVQGPGIISSITGTDVLFDSVRWEVKPKNRFMADTSGFYFSDMGFFSGNSVLDINGAITHHPGDSLKMNFQNLDISHIDRLFIDQGIDINGVLNGQAVLVNLYSVPNFLANLTLDDFYFNGADFGSLSLKTIWNNPIEALAVDLNVSRLGNLGTSVILDVDGNYYPYGNDMNFDFDAKLNNLSTHIFNPFVEEFVDISRESLASGSLKIYGSFQKPVMTGKVSLMRTQFLIKYLNTLYSAAGSVQFAENIINLNDITLYDTRQKSAKCTGNITHDYFDNLNFDLFIKNENFIALNTTARDNGLFYGTARMTGEITIKGPPDDVKMDIKAKTEDGTRIMIPISSELSVSDNNFIVFLTNENVEQKQQESYKVNLKGLMMNFDLEVTPSAEVKIFLPYNMGYIEGTGGGNLRLGINPRGDFTMTGDYMIREGDFFFTIEKLIGRNFKIREGSHIAWAGNPYEATVDIRAVYKIKTDLSGLRLQTDSTMANTRVPVECNIFLQNELFNPDIRFSIDFPSVEENVKQVIYASLDTTDQSALSQQMLSLLVLGSFSYTSSSPGIEATGFKFLSKQLSNWLSKISKDVDIGINYKPGSEMSEEELEVALQTQLFDDKLSIDGNFGVRGNSTNQNTSNVIGDILVEYKITDDGRFRVKAFNRTNDITLLQDNAPYTQGVGVFYKKEFDKVGDLLKKEKKEKRQKRAERKNPVKDTADRE